MLDNLRKREARGLVRSVIEEITDVEGPLHVDRLIRLTGNAFGFTRVSADRQARIRRQLPQSDVRVDGDFVWPSGIDPTRWLIYRIAPNGERPFREVCTAELVNAMCGVAKTRGPLSTVDLRRAVLEVFGRSRATAHADNALSEALETAIADGRLVNEHDLIRLAIPQP